MPGQIVYLDSSALVKRYVKEAGTEIVDRLFEDAESSKAVICSSLWCIGEAVGVFDRYNRRGVIKLDSTLDKFFNEIKRLGAKGNFNIIEVTSELVSESVEKVVKHHIYIADALQIATCKATKCDRFLTSDKALNEAAKKDGITSVLLH